MEYKPSLYSFEQLSSQKVHGAPPTNFGVLSMPWCLTCNVFWFGTEHEHIPEYECLIVDDYIPGTFKVDGEDWRKLRATNPERAAQKIGEKYDQEGDFYLLRKEENSIRVRVRLLGDTKEKVFKVRAENVPTHYAEEVKEYAQI